MFALHRTIGPEHSHSLSIECEYTVWQHKQCPPLDWRLIASKIIITSRIFSVLCWDEIHCIAQIIISHIAIGGFGSTARRQYLRGFISCLNGNMDLEACWTYWKTNKKKKVKKIRLLQPFNLLQNSNQLMDGTVQENIFYLWVGFNLATWGAIASSRGGNVRRNAEFLETANLLSWTENIGLLARAVRFAVMWAGFLLGRITPNTPLHSFSLRGSRFSLCIKNSITQNN